MYANLWHSGTLPPAAGHPMSADPAALATAYAGAYCCPDCASVSELTERAPGVFVLAVAHDDTCPTLRRMAR